MAKEKVGHGLLRCGDPAYGVFTHVSWRAYAAGRWRFTDYGRVDCGFDDAPV